MDTISAASVVEELEQESSTRIFTGPAKRLIDKLSPMSSHVETYQKRWFWELLQNACDYNDKVKVEVEITREFLYFRHNGGPFTMNQALNLILPDSDKDDKTDRGIVGKYGSGFIATHILSTEIGVSGQLLTKQNEECPFNFILNRVNREESEKALLASALQESREQFKQSLLTGAAEKGNLHTTEFRYSLKKSYSFVDPTATIERGLSFIEEVLPYVFAFQPKLIEVAIKMGDELSIYSCTRTDESRVTTTVIDYEGGNPKATSQFTIRLFPNEDTFVGVEVADEKIVEFPKDFPKLFKVYPLIGTEDFPFPCVVHSLDLVPTLERSAIELSENDQSNREVLKKATVAYGLMLAQLSKENCRCFYNVCELSSGTLDANIRDWFKAYISDKLKGQLLEQPVVITSKGTRASFKNISVPCVASEHYTSYHKLMAQTNFSIPVKDESEMWSNTINFSLFPDTKFDFKNLLENTVGKKHPLNAFLKTDDSSYDWIKSLIDLIIVCKEEDLLKKYPIVPQQDGKLRALDGQLFWDNEIPEELKDMLELVSENSYRKILLHKSLEELENQLLDSKREKSEKDILDAIDKAMKEAANGTPTPKFLDALRRILKWTDKMEPDELRTKMSWFAAERPLLVMRTLTSEANRDMVFAIIQSGKIEILSDLAKSNITTDKLAKFIELDKTPGSIDQILRVGKIADVLGGFQPIIDAAEELVEEKLDFEFKRQIGKDVEDVLKELLSTDLPHYRPEYKGSGPYDFVIRNETNGLEYYLELKSIKENNTEPIKMAISQARHACEFPDRSALCVIKRPEGTGVLTKEVLRAKIKCVYQVGKDVKVAVDEAGVVGQIIRTTRSIKLSIKDSEMKVFLDQKYIDGLGKDFESLKGKIKEQLR